MSTRLRRPILALILPLALVAGVHCGDRLEDQACPDVGTDLTYDNFGQAFFSAHCNECHAAVVKDRQGAPPSFVFDTREQIVDHIDRIFVRSAGDNTSMPPGPDDPPEEERAALAEWLACDAP
jgi:uncharacterized membrane protein